ncbi:unnamed protein product [Dracunculus medinensis]|uniref:E3 UFM1-protein ligase 1 homolog n=1 Tax=Dracunculus medinensis TaxID=318479 RepID=A0A0N4U0H0_DRAME|nr:unnamed protein product [Dracunculus medinensis]
MATTWADIKRLAADLQRVQLLEGTKKLSEKNCVEVVSILIGSKAVDLVFTVDGQHYITKKHLLTEIKNECLGNGGRISLSALAQVLNVNYDVIESVGSFHRLSHSRLLENALFFFFRCYIDHLCSEINEQLTEVGALSISYLVKNWNLPFDLLNDHIFAKVGCKINATRDFDILYTQNYLSAQKNLIRAVVNALTKVTPVSKMIDSIGISPSLFWTLFDELLSCNEIPGKTIGSRNSSHIFYVPNIHTKLSRLFVTKTFAEHQLLELSILKKLSITDPLSFLKELLPESDFKSLIFLPSKLLKEIMENVENEVQLVDRTTIEKSKKGQKQASKTEDVVGDFFYIDLFIILIFYYCFIFLFFFLLVDHLC